jgi:hypothetical protein
MSSTRKIKAGDHEYLVAAIANRKALEHEFNVVAYTTVGMCDRLGVLAVRTEVRKKGEALSKAPLCSYAGEWPNAQVIGWTAFLLQHFSKLYLLVQDSLTVPEDMLKPG